MLRLRDRHRLLHAVIACAVGLAGVAAPASAAGLHTSAEYVVNFVRYVRWPDEAAIATWRVCIAGNLPSAEDRLYADESVRGKPFEARRIDATDALDACDVLDLTAADPSLARSVLQHAHGRTILSVGRGAAFCADGGHICLHARQSGRAFELNLEALREARLGVIARLVMLGMGDEAVP